jgi:hypothetical protein
MNTVCSLSLVGILAMGSALPACVSPSSKPDVFQRRCGQMRERGLPQIRSVLFAAATISQIDYQQGLINLETELGRVLTFVAPEEIQGLHEGDQIVMCLAKAIPAADLSQYTISS